MALSASSNLEVFLRLRDEATAGVRQFSRELGNMTGAARLSAGELRTLGTIIGVAGGSLVAMAVLAARAADGQNRLGQRVNDLKGNLNELAQTVGTALLPVMLTFLDAANATLEVVNKLPDPLVQIGGGLALIGGGLLTVLGSMALFISILKELNAILKVTIVLQTIQRALSGPLGIALVIGAVALGAGAAALVSGIGPGSFQGGTERVPGPPGSPQLVIAHGGESIGGSGGGDTIILQGIFMGTEREAQRLADMIHEKQRRKRRTTTDGREA